MVNTRLWCAAVVVVVGSARAHAQCRPEWLPQPSGTGLDGYVRALGTYQGQLVVGGAFTQASGRQANRVAHWDGKQWAALGGGLNGLVNAVQEFNGELYVAGEFSTAGGQPAGGIARWNGVAWSDLGTSSTTFLDLVVFENQLVATSGGVVRWNGTSWSGFGSGIDFIALTLAVHEGFLYAAGKSFALEPVARVARWDGVAWQDMGSIPSAGAGAQVKKLAVHNGQLYAGGFNTAVSNVHRWTGSGWQPVGTVNLWFGVYGMASYRGDLIVGGTTFNGGQGLARWDGSAWTNLGLGLNASVLALTVHEGTLIAGGAFTTAGGLPSPNWARYGCACEPDCNNSGSLSVADFGCFQGRYVLGDLYADCNASGTLTVADFGCFQGKYVLGCP